MTTIPTTIIATSTVRGGTCFPQNGHAPANCIQTADKNAGYCLCSGPVATSTVVPKTISMTVTTTSYSATTLTTTSLERTYPTGTPGEPVLIDQHIFHGLSVLQCHIDEDPRYRFQLCSAICMWYLVNFGLIWFAALIVNCLALHIFDYKLIFGLWRGQGSYGTFIEKCNISPANESWRSGDVLAPMILHMKMSLLHCVVHRYACPGSTWIDATMVHRAHKPLAIDH